MGSTLRKFTRPIRNFNIENRAFKELDRQKKVKIGEAAPRHVIHQHQEIDGDSMNKQDRDDFERQTMKDDSLVERVAKMGINTKIVQDKKSTRPLPVQSETPKDEEYGFHIPATISKGKVTLPQVIEFLTKYKDEYPNYTTKDIASEYQLGHAKVMAVVRHFQMLNIFLPKKVLEKATELERFNAVHPTMLEKLTTVKSRSQGDEEGVDNVDELEDKRREVNTEFSDKNIDIDKSEKISGKSDKIDSDKIDSDKIDSESKGKVHFSIDESSDTLGSLHSDKEDCSHIQR